MPVPFGFRVFGPLNMPGPYAVALLVGMLFLLGTSRRGTFLSLLLGLIALMLTRTRSALGGPGRGHHDRAIHGGQSGG